MRAAAGLMLLAGCAAAPDDPLAGWPSYRDRTQPIASKALFDPAAFAGDWQVVARYPTPFEAGCAASTFRFEGARVGYACADAAGTTIRQAAGAVATVAPARLEVTMPGAEFPAPAFWVLWVDESYRTAVIGTPDGRAGWILNRGAQIPADRRTAAREILDFNGYDLTQLQGVGG